MFKKNFKNRKTSNQQMIDFTRMETFNRNTDVLY